MWKNTTKELRNKINFKGGSAEKLGVTDTIVIFLQEYFYLC